MTRTSGWVESPDITVQREGSIFLLHLHTPEARLWVDEYVNQDDAQWWAGALVVEHRYVNEIAFGAIDDGLVVI